MTALEVFEYIERFYNRIRTHSAFGFVSGETLRSDGITKAGNRLARTAPIESAWHYSMCKPRPKAPAADVEVPAATRSRADDRTARPHRRREALAAAGKPACRANAAVARELACWVWGIGRRAKGTLG